jgi:hypothetical protein
MSFVSKAHVVLTHIYYTTVIIFYFHVRTVRAPREVSWEVGAGEGGDYTAHAHSAYSYSEHIVLQ